MELNENEVMKDFVGLYFNYWYFWEIKVNLDIVMKGRILYEDGGRKR